MAKPLTFQIIEKAKELIQDERHWCRGYLGCGCLWRLSRSDE